MEFVKICAICVQKKSFETACSKRRKTRGLKVGGILSSGSNTCGWLSCKFGSGNGFQEMGHSNIIIFNNSVILQ